MAYGRHTLIPVVLTVITTLSLMFVLHGSPFFQSPTFRKEETRNSEKQAIAQEPSTASEEPSSTREAVKKLDDKGRPKRKEEDFNVLFCKVPYAIRSCRDLSRNKTLPADFEEDFADFLVAVQEQGPTMGHTGLPEFREIYIMMQEIAKSRFVKTICETGFNAGHSSFGWLRSNPTAQVYSFDIGTNTYARPMAAYLQEKFPGRHHVTWGDSRETLSRFREENPDVRCDLMMIDGGHYYDVVRSDFDNFHAMANHVNIVIMDNYPDERFMWMGDMWERSKRASQLFEFFTCTYWGEDPEGMSFGRFNV